MDRGDCPIFGSGESTASQSPLCGPLSTRGCVRAAYIAGRVCVYVHTRRYPHHAACTSSLRATARRHLCPHHATLRALLPSPSSPPFSIAAPPLPPPPISVPSAPRFSSDVDRRDVDEARALISLRDEQRARKCAFEGFKGEESTLGEEEGEKGKRERECTSEFCKHGFSKTVIKYNRSS